MQRREGVNGRLAPARRPLPTRVAESTRRNDDPRPRAFRADDAPGRRSAAFLLGLRDLGRKWRRRLLDREPLVERGGGFAGLLRERAAERDRKHQRKRRAREETAMTRTTHGALPQSERRRRNGAERENFTAREPDHHPDRKSTRLNSS